MERGDQRESCHRRRHRHYHQPPLRPDIVASLPEEGHPVSRRTFVEVRSHPFIQVNRGARMLTYTWKKPPPLPAP